MILEVSQKQAYIFESTKLKENVERSEEICRVTDPAYFELAAKQSSLAFDKEKNVVYSGGGHTVLEFPDRESAEKFAYAISSRVRRERTCSVFTRNWKRKNQFVQLRSIRALSE